jgi:hypothetical protein
MSDSDSDYSVESVSSENSVEQQDDVLKQLYAEGGLQTENILEIQLLLKLINEKVENEETKLKMGKCLELLINLSNMFLHIHSDNNKC